MIKLYKKGFTLFCSAMITLSCTDLDQPLPAGVEDPETVKSEYGALSVYRGVMASFSRAYAQYIINTALFTDIPLKDSADMLV